MASSETVDATAPVTRLALAVWQDDVATVKRIVEAEAMRAARAVKDTVNGQDAPTTTTNTTTGTAVADIAVELPPSTNIANNSSAADDAAAAAVDAEPEPVAVAVASRAAPDAVRGILETKDAQGNTPLMLAVKLGRCKAAAELIKAGASVRSRDPGSWTVANNAIHLFDRDQELVKAIFDNVHSQTMLAWDRKVPQLAAALSTVPDFVTTFNFSLSTWIPFVSRILPSDTVNVFKHGANLRLDCTLAGFKNMSWKRGHLSFLFFGADTVQGSKTIQAGTLLVLDHKAKRYADLLAGTRSSTPKERLKSLQAMLTTNTAAFNVWSRDVEIEPALHWWSKKQVTHKLSGWTAKEFALRHMKLRVDMRQPLKPATFKLVEDDSDDSDEEDTDATPPTDAQEIMKQLQSAVTAAPVITDAPIVGEPVPVSDTTKHFSIARGTLETQTLHLQANQRVSWKVACVDRDISFSIHVKAADAGSEDTTAAGTEAKASDADADADADGADDDGKGSLVHSGERIGSADGQFVATQAVVCEFELDNSYALWHTKEVDLVLKVEQVELDEDAQLMPAALPAATTGGGAGGGAGAGAGTGAGAGAGATQDGEADEEQGTFQEVLPTRSMTFSQYFAMDAEEAAGLHAITEELQPKGTFAILPSSTSMRKSFRAKVYMTDEFPLPLSHLLPVAEVLSRTGQHFENFNRFLHSKLPPGFPIKFEVPVVPTVTAKFEFVSAHVFDDEDKDSKPDSESKDVAPTAAQWVVPDDYLKVKMSEVLASMKSKGTRKGKSKGQNDEC